MVHPVPWLCWAVPVVGALLTPVFAKISHKVRDYAAVSFSFVGAVLAVLLIPNLLAGKYYDEVLSEWIFIPGRSISVGVLVDPLSIVMANVVAVISFLIMIYSLGYMHGDPCLTRYWFFMNFFIGNMLLLVLSDNLLQVLIGWEGVGLCSYGLIGFYYRDEKDRWLGGPPPTPMYPPSECGMKAFVVTRVGDVFLLGAAFIIYLFAGTFNFTEMFSTAPQWLAEMSRYPGLIALTSVLILGGPIGKSAQFPLHEWLPEAMAGPTTVSALIHAATMVKAGVYLVARVLPIFYLGYWLLHLSEALAFFTVIASIGAFTAFLAASQAMVSLEIKKVLAYSTVSQIGYMMLGLGCSGLSPHALMTGYVAGVFHLMSHALFKAALFLCAGSVLHLVESIYMSDMGGLRKVMPITYLFMVVAGLSLSGVPPFSGFWSKDLVLVASLESGQFALFLLGAATAAMTFFYTIRFLSMIFTWKKSHHLEEREHELEHEGKHLHEAPKVMWAPIGVLVILILGVSVAGIGDSIGLTGPETFLHQRLEYITQEYIFANAPGYVGERVQETVHGLGVGVAAAGAREDSAFDAHLVGVTTSLAMLALGGWTGYRIYMKLKPSPEKIIADHLSLRAIWMFFWNRWYLNPTYYRVFVQGTLKLKQAVWEFFEQAVIDKINIVAVKVTLFVSSWSFRILETLGIDRGLNIGIPESAESIYHRIKKTQTGLLGYNMLYIGFTLLVILILFLVSF